VKSGKLYKLKSRWYSRGMGDWENKFALHVGESVINRDDGVKITNLVFLLNGERRITDQSFWRCIECVDG
jgi:hypothetical protein